MLLLFIFSITPKKYFHDLIADHIDYSVSSIEGSSTIQDSGVNCHFQNLVAESPFTRSAELRFAPNSYYFSPEEISFYQGHLRSFCPSLDNKGPPSYHT